MKRNYLLIMILALIIIATLEVFTRREPRNDSNKLAVVASFYPMYFFAAQIGGDKADVFSITPSSVEPHDYEPTTQDIARIENANLLVLNGGALEAWGDKIKQDVAGKNIKVVVAGGNLVNRQIEQEGKQIRDPHVWLDPVLAKVEIEYIEKGFESVDGNDSEYFRMNANSFETKLDQLDKEYKSGLSNCQKKDFVTSHAAFGYLAARYDINQVAISGISPDEEPSSQKLAEISDLVKKEDIKVIFFESLISPKLSETIAKESGAKAMVLDPIEGISDDKIKAGINYLTVMKSNLAALRSALVCGK